MPGMNYHDYNSVLFICPFYRSERGNCLTCEGMIKYSTNRTCFTKKAMLERHKQKYCYTYNYKGCHWARLLEERKYGG